MTNQQNESTADREIVITRGFTTTIETTIETMDFRVGGKQTLARFGEYLAEMSSHAYEH